MRRDKLEVIADILLAVQEPRKKTRILQIANLSFNNGEPKIALLLKNGLIKKDGNLYHLATKGLCFLQRHDELKEMIE